jgi:hypothetical protein
VKLNGRLVVLEPSAESGDRSQHGIAGAVRMKLATLDEVGPAEANSGARRIW